MSYARAVLHSVELGATRLSNAPYFKITFCALDNLNAKVIGYLFAHNTSMEGSVIALIPTKSLLAIIKAYEGCIFDINTNTETYEGNLILKIVYFKLVHY